MVGRGVSNYFFAIRDVLRHHAARMHPGIPAREVSLMCDRVAVLALGGPA